jgi:hypothetical protein
MRAWIGVDVEYRPEDQDDARGYAERMPVKEAMTVVFP